MRKHLANIERCVLVALEVAANEYRKEYGRFLPFAVKKIHHVFEDLNERKIKWKNPGGYKKESDLDVYALRKSLMQYERIRLEDADEDT